MDIIDITESNEVTIFLHPPFCCSNWNFYFINGWQ